MNLTFTASIDIPDKDAFLAAVKTQVRKVFMKAGQKFLLASIPRIPIWTGMLRGAFRNAEDLFGKVTNEGDPTLGKVRIRTTQGKGTAGRGGGEKITQTYRKGYYYNPPGGGRVPRTPQSGRAFATPTQNILDLTGATLATGRTAFYFKFKIDITYFDLLDEARGWNAFKLGAAAFESYVKANLKLPDPLEYTTRKTITSG